MAKEFERATKGLQETAEGRRIIQEVKVEALRQATDAIEAIRMADLSKASDPRRSGQRGMDRSDAFGEAQRAITALIRHPGRATGVVPVSEWPKKNDEPVLIYVVHENAKHEPDLAIRQAKWEGWFNGYWTDFNNGGWVWHGMIGEVTHVALQPPRPELAP